jgi:hypothetical protein
MRFALLMSLLVLTAACGGGGGGSNNNGAQNQQATVLGDGTSPDLMEAIVDAETNISGSDILFTKARSNRTTGKTISCSLGVSEGEVYRYAINGDTMDLLTKSGSYTMVRDFPGTGLVGSKWNYKGTEGNTDVRMMMYVVNNTKVIMRKWCEQI